MRQLPVPFRLIQILEKICGRMAELFAERKTNQAENFYPKCRRKKAIFVGIWFMENFRELSCGNISEFKF